MAFRETRVFRELRIDNKKQILNETKKEIIEGIKPMFLNFDDLSIISISNYIDELLLESDYSDHHFRYPIRYPITNDVITIKDFASITYSYIIEHMEEFLLCA